KGRDPREPPSYIDIADGNDRSADQPLKALDELITAAALKADAVICCGDLADAADPLGIKYSWDYLRKLKKQVQASLLVSAVGNHDIDSRFQSQSYDPREFIQSLKPTFPGHTAALSNQFWARHFVIYRHGAMRVLLVDSCAYHGIKHEYNHGRISDPTLGEIERRLTADGPCELNLMVCHHHPQKLADYNLGDYDDMLNGQKILDRLGYGKHGDWIVLHGHKHCPKISYAAGGANSPLVFSCGSIGARLFPELGASARNQWYLLEFPTELFAVYGVVGTFTAWDWIPSHGYQKARIGSGLPHQGGFGNRTPLAVVASTIRSLFNAPGRLDWTTICGRRPDLRFILPGDLRRLKEILETNHNIRLDFSEFGLIEEIELLA
ncbi:MAG TPA: metallophosphoesterase, partial [Chthoniobacterales bacterium]|nr:metallophosphoesterase [Chthoniobacterales bacterium]